MDLDEVAARLRRRQGAQAVDLGLLLCRRFWWAVLKPWLVVVVPLLVVVQTAVGLVVSPMAAVLVGWWMKPLFDRVTLYVISRGFFGSVPTTGETLKAVVGQWFSRRMLVDLTIRRPLGDRSVTMPVFVLEGNQRSQIKNRLSSLYDGSARSAGWLLAGMALGFKFVLYASLVALAVALTPSEIFANQMVLVEYLTEQADQWVVVAVVVASTTLVTTVVEPFYGAGGFGVYIQRRIEREGWDLEIRFRRLAERIEDVLDGTAVVVAVFAAAVLLAAGVGSPGGAVAHEEPAATAEEEAPMTEVPDEGEQIADDDTEAPLHPDLMPVDDPQEVADEILDDAPFSPEPETRKQWVRVEDEDQQREVEEFELQEEPALDFQETVAAVLRVVAWVVFALVVVFALYKIGRFVNERRSGPDRADRQAHWEQQLANRGVDADLSAGARRPQQVRQWWEEGQPRRALAAMLLRSLVGVEQRYQLEFPDGWTIERCARRVAHQKPEGPVIVKLAGAFDETVWAGRSLSDEQFAVLWRRWVEAFEQREGTDA